MTKHKTIKELENNEKDTEEIGYCWALKDVLELIDERIDHWKPYRPLTESEEAIAVRKELQELKARING